MSSDFNFTEASCFLGNVHVKPISTHNALPLPRFLQGYMKELSQMFSSISVFQASIGEKLLGKKHGKFHGTRKLSSCPSKGVSLLFSHPNFQTFLCH